MIQSLALPRPLRLQTESDVERALELRRAAASAFEVPGSWLLDSPGMSDVVESARRLARLTGAPILLQGERGSGVSELARLIHETDPVARSRRFRMVAAQQAKISEMRAGTSDGTLLIEDVEHLRPAVQAWMGEVVNDRTESARPLRIIASSRLGVAELLEQRQLGQELVHMLDVGRLVIPPLRERSGDILQQARRFLDLYAARLDRPALRFSPDAERKLLSHDYPANVRELRNVVERAMALGSSDEIGEDAIVFHDERSRAKQRAEVPRPLASKKADDTVCRIPTFSELERDYLRMLIRKVDGRRSVMSRIMGISYQTVLKKIARHGLDVRAILAEGAEPDSRVAE